MYLRVKMMDISLLSPCNAYCGNCAVYKKGKCLGCKTMGEKRESEGKVFCIIYLCARDRNLTHAQTVHLIHAKNTTKESSQRAIKWVREKLGEH